MSALVQILAIAVFAVSVAVLASYLFGLEPLRRWMEPPMAVNTALCFWLLSFAVWLLGRRK